MPHGSRVLRTSHNKNTYYFRSRPDEVARHVELSNQNILPRQKKKKITRMGGDHKGIEDARKTKQRRCVISGQSLL